MQQLGIIRNTYTDFKGFLLFLVIIAIFMGFCSVCTNYLENFSKIKSLQANISWQWP